MKLKTLFILTAVYFLQENTSYFWLSNWGAWAMFVALGQILFFLVLLTIMLYQINFVFTEKPLKKIRIALVVFMSLVLSSSIAFPNGIINYAAFEKEPLLVAFQEGVANCTITLKLNPDSTFLEKSICFGLTETTGKYSIKGDTIFFHPTSLGRGEQSFSKFALFEHNEDKNLGYLVKYDDELDTLGYPLSIVKNEMK